MTKTPWTPGPWNLHIGLDYFEIENENGSCVLPEVRCNPESEREVADAKLIAKAPEMAAMLIDILKDGADWLSDECSEKLRRILQEVGAL